MSALIIDGRLVHYESYGRGPTVIFLHTWLDAWRSWVPAMEELSEHYRTYALDFWGFGSSNGMRESYSEALAKEEGSRAIARGSYTLDAYTALLSDFIDELGLSEGELVLVGHGLGAVVALQFATKYPSCVSKLVLIALPLNPSAITKRLRRGSGWLFRGLPEAVRVEAEKVSREVVKQTAKAVIALGDLRPLLIKLDVSTLLIHGEGDKVIKPFAAEELDRIRPNLRAFILPGGHFLMLDEAAKFNRLLLDFLTEDDLSKLEIKEEWRRRTH